MKYSLLVFGLMLICTYYSYSQTIDGDDIRYLEEKFINYSKDYPGSSITIIQENQIAWQKEAGYADVKNQLPVTSNTKFNIYSTSKFILGLAYLKLVDQGKVSLDQKIRELDPDLPESYADITIKHLLTHRSGIRHYDGKKDWIAFAELDVNSPEEAVAYFKNDPLVHKPGEKEQYTTFGMVLASHLLEIITGKDFESAINEILTFSEPLNLDSKDAKKSATFLKIGKEINVNAKSKFGGGGFIASSQQLAEAGAMLFDESINTIDNIKAMFKGQWESDVTNGIAFGTGAGFSKETFGQPDVLYCAIGGGSPGGRSYLFVVVDLKISIAVTTNLEGDGEEAYQLVFDLVKQLANMNDN